MRRILTILIVAVVTVSSVCGACALSCDTLCACTENKPADCKVCTNIENKSVVCGEWSIEIPNHSADNSNDGDTEIIEVVQFPEESSDNGEWTIQI